MHSRGAEMTHMKRLFVIALLVLSSLTMAAPEFNGAAEYRIGDTIIFLPTPKGFVETSSKSEALWRTAQLFGTESTRAIAHYVLASEFETYSQGIAVVFSDYAYVKTPRQWESISISQKQFDKLRVGTIDSLSSVLKSTEPRLSSEIERMLKGIPLQGGKPLALRVGSIVPVSINENRENFFSYTFISTVESGTASDKSVNTWLATTGTCLIKGKAVILNTYRLFHGPSDLRESREYVNAWAHALLTRN